MEKEKSMHELAVRLCEGGSVQIDGHWVKAVQVPDDVIPCEECQMDSACRMSMADLCGECEAYTHKRYYLKFAYQK